jgi:hypothetical protein
LPDKFYWWERKTQWWSRVRLPCISLASFAGSENDGNQGSWAASASIDSAGSMTVAVDGDNYNNNRSHISEEVDYIVFSTAGSVALSPA